MSRKKLFAKGIASFFCGGMGFVFLIISLNYTVDPLKVLRKSNFNPPLFYTNERFLTPGLALNYTKPTIILGPSNFQIFHSDLVENVLQKPVLNLSIAASTLYTQRLTLEMAIRSGVVKEVLWGMEWASIAVDPMKARNLNFPTYLYKNEIRSILKYLINVEISSLSLSLLVERHFPQFSRNKFSRDMEITKRWDEHKSLSTWVTLRNLALTISSPDNNESLRENFYSTAKTNVDTNLIPIIRSNPKINFKLIIPPSNITMWAYYQQYKPKHFAENFKLKAYLKKLNEEPNVEVIDLQLEPSLNMWTDAYRDGKHFSPIIVPYIIQHSYGLKNSLRKEYPKVSISEQLLLFDKYCNTINFLNKLKDVTTLHKSEITPEMFESEMLCLQELENLTAPLR